MSAEADFHALMARIARDPAARVLADDAAALAVGGERLVLTKDMLVEGVHFLPDDPPGDVAWKLVAVNLSDLAAKGARPLGILLGYGLRGAAWDRDFAEGLASCLDAFALPLLGGDTVSLPARCVGVLSLTAIGAAGAATPSRGGAQPGDQLWVSGSIGDAGAGLAVLRGALEGDAALVRRYRRPQPRLEAGQRLAPLVTAMMDVSDGLLIDAGRMAAASRLEARIDLASVPLSDAFSAALGDDRAARVRAATAGDDYELLFAAPRRRARQVLELSEELGLPLTPIGAFAPGAGLALTHEGAPTALPERLGYEHDAPPQTQP
jgi:thiamine-monophosphate kinase